MDSPDTMTSETGRLADFAMKPMMEKTTKPAKKLVPQLRHGMSRASLYGYKQHHYPSQDFYIP